MDLNEIRKKLEVFHAGFPQPAMLAQIALDRIEAGILELSALGHNFHLEERDPNQVVVVFPKMLYMDGKPEMLVHSSSELSAALDDGWREHPTEEGIEVGPRPEETQIAEPVEVASEPHPIMGALKSPTAEPALADEVPSEEELQAEAEEAELVQEFDTNKKKKRGSD